IAPIRDDRGIEGCLVAALRMGRPKEMATGAYFPYRFYRQRILGQVEWGKEFLHHLQKIDIEDEFLVGGSQPAFQPACAMQEEITSALDGSPQGKDALIGSLRINGVCGAG